MVAIDEDPALDLKPWEYALLVGCLIVIVVCVVLVLVEGGMFG